MRPPCTETTREFVVSPIHSCSFYHFFLLFSPTRQFLNEKIPGLPYECLGQFGHVHQPLFRMVVVFNGKVYQGEGSSKKSAKIDAAQNAANDWFKV